MKVLRTGGIVLCGGRGLRMGTAKAWLRCGEEYWLQRIVRLLAGVVAPVVVAAREGQDLPSLPQGVQVVRDQADHRGPLGGILAGFAALRGRCEAAFVVSCDQPLLVPTFVGRLIELLADHPAVVPRHEGRLHPLTAVYRLDTASMLTELLGEQQWRVQTFTERCGAHTVEGSDMAAVDLDLVSLWNANDPAAYERIARRFQSGRQES